MVGGGGGEDDQADLARIDPRSLQRAARRFGGEAAGGLVRFGEITLANTGPLDDPFVRSVDTLCQIGIGDEPTRESGPRAGQDRTDHFAAPFAANPISDTSPRS